MPKIHVIESELWLPQPPQTIFPFFADAHNLESITPAFLKFQVVTPKPIEMHAGTLIDYRLRIHGVPIGWRTRIRDWEPPYRFVDEQLRGPYRQWIHEHTFTEERGGTLCRDRVEYSVYGGALVHALFVRKDVANIFAYRTEQLLARFGK